MARRWLIPDDGIVDEVAIERAAAGMGPVRLTPAERRLAAALILAMGHGTRAICARLGVTDRTACALARQVAVLPAAITRRNELAAAADGVFPAAALPPALTAAAS